MEFVLVHGTTQSPAGWDRLTAELGARCHSATLIDLPTSRPEWTVAVYADEAAAQPGEPAGRRVVVGHSGAGVLLPAIAAATFHSIIGCFVPADYIPFRPSREKVVKIGVDTVQTVYARWHGCRRTGQGTGTRESVTSGRSGLAPGRCRALP